MMLHKIDIDNKNIFLQENDSFYLEINSDVKLDISVNKNIDAKLIIIGNSSYDLNIKLYDNASLIVNSINKDNNTNINIDLEKETNILYNHSVLGRKDSIHNFNIVHIGNNSTSLINNNGINLDINKLFFNINGNIPSNLLDISCSQNSKIINYNKGNSKIIPNLIIDSNDIVANHSAYIGTIDNEILFYLQSRGIKKETIEKMIYKATMLGKMNLDEEREMFNKIIDEWW